MNTAQRAAKQIRDAMTRDELEDMLNDAESDLAQTKLMPNTWHTRYEAQRQAAEASERAAKVAEGRVERLEKALRDILLVVNYPSTARKIAEAALADVARKESHNV